MTLSIRHAVGSGSFYNVLITDLSTGLSTGPTPGSEKVKSTRRVLKRIN